MSITTPPCTLRHPRRPLGHAAAPRWIARLAAACLSLTGMVLVGCAAVAPPATPPDPCALVTDAQAAAFLGAQATRAGPAQSNGSTSCAWTTENGALLSVHVFSGRQYFPSGERQRYPGAHPVSGIGDEAFVSPDLAGVRVGDTVVFVDAVGAGTDAALEDILRVVTGRT
jgi:hypothetical protein